MANDDEELTTGSEATLCWFGRLSFISFLFPILVSLLMLIALANHTVTLGICFVGFHLTLAAIEYAWFAQHTRSWFQTDWIVSVTATGLGAVFSFGICLFCVGTPVLRPFGVYLTLLAFFHFSEFFTTAYIKPSSLNVSSYLLNNGGSYWLALAVSWIEYFVGVYYWPQFKQVNVICCLGIALSLLGELFRKVAMLTAGSNFDHMIHYKKRTDHRLVTHGIYSWFRHPSYVGWLWWAVGTQLILLNPICLITYTIVTWHFFNQRILSEEISLLNFFGKEYMDYQRRVRTGIPFVSGYIIGQQLKHIHHKSN
jgi:protein-S-isoprenylcysteine O-methyltransferase